MMFTDQEPGSDPRLAAVIAAAGAPAESPLPGEAAARTAYRRELTRHGRLLPRLRARPAQAVAAALFGGVLVAGGVATAATGSLPLVGTHHSGHHAPARPTAPTRASGHSHPAAPSASSTGTTSDRPGGRSSTHAHSATHSLGSVAKGAATCTSASGGTCRAGRRGAAASAHDHRSGAHASNRGRDRSASAGSASRSAHAGSSADTTGSSHGGGQSNHLSAGKPRHKG
jgi:hypothetical protein